MKLLSKQTKNPLVEAEVEKKILENMSSGKVRVGRSGEKVVGKNLVLNKDFELSKSESVFKIRQARDELEKLAKENGIDINVKLGSNEYYNTLRYTIDFNRKIIKKRNLKSGEIYKKDFLDKKFYSLKEKVIGQAIQDLKNKYIKGSLKVKKHLKEASITGNIGKIKIKIHLPLYSKYIPGKIRYGKEINIKN